MKLRALDIKGAGATVPEHGGASRVCRGTQIFHCNPVIFAAAAARSLLQGLCCLLGLATRLTEKIKFGPLIPNLHKYQTKRHHKKTRAFEYLGHLEKAIVVTS